MEITTYIVTLEIETRCLPLHELSSTIGIEGNPNSVDGGEGFIWENGVAKPQPTVWKIESDASPEDELGQHLESVAEQIKGINLSQINLPSDADICLEVGIFFQTAMCGFNLPVEWMQFFAENNIRVSVSCYPCSDD